MGIQVRVGDVFLVPLDGKSWALGQLVNAWNDELYVAIFGEKAVTKDVDPKSVISQEPVLLSLTLDAKLFRGHWPILGNVKENLADLPQPAFKVLRSGVPYIVSRDRSVSRPAVPAELKLLHYRTVSSPAVIEKVVQGYFGIGDGIQHYSKHSADYAYESGRLL